MAPGPRFAATTLATGVRPLPAITERILTAALAGVSVLAACSPAPALSDKKICEAAALAGNVWTLTSVQGGASVSADDQRKIFTRTAEHLDSAAEGSDTDVGEAVRLFAAQVTEASTASDPISALGTPETKKAGKALNDACEKAGITTYC